ncbi:acyl-CoA thioesterase [Winogradskyella ursingii]|uniref:acyl-CoA thioesterase n=1 Tax=Winogradskyella ursingii TaxID=2686079 RepID=UPI0015C72B72|nr:thioesterase family protein [Winogradskyella ursingii]
MTQKNESLTIEHTIRVRFNETDALGIVWHGNYLKYFEDGREAFGRHFGISYLEAKKNGYATPIVKTTTDHKLPLKYGDVATVETTFVNSRAAKMTFQYKIKNEAGDVVCTGETIQVFTDLKTETMLFVIPEFFENWKKQHGILNE